ncbi:hypothetical protein LMG24235_07637 [Paraburkholderia sabiae]|jgi:hypothetical protein|nr:hypothetical protein LMG24235_07637 [Paraburkholderia sabiae]
MFPFAWVSQQYGAGCIDNMCVDMLKIGFEYLPGNDHVQ